MKKNIRLRYSGMVAGTSNASIALRRRLAADGSTAKAWVASHPGLDSVVGSCARTFQAGRPYQSAVQEEMAMVGSCWKSTRASRDTTSIRTAFGYNESEMCINYFLHGEAITQPSLRQGLLPATSRNGLSMIAIISDIHGNHAALTAVLAETRQAGYKQRYLPWRYSRLLLPGQRMLRNADTEKYFFPDGKSRLVSGDERRVPSFAQRQRMRRRTSGESSSHPTSPGWLH